MSTMRKGEAQRKAWNVLMHQASHHRADVRLALAFFRWQRASAPEAPCPDLIGSDLWVPVGFEDQAGDGHWVECGTEQGPQEPAGPQDPAVRDPALWEEISLSGALLPVQAADARPADDPDPPCRCA